MQRPWRMMHGGIESCCIVGCICLLSWCSAGVSRLAFCCRSSSFLFRAVRVCVGVGGHRCASAVCEQAQLQGGGEQGSRGRRSAASSCVHLRLPLLALHSFDQWRMHAVSGRGASDSLEAGAAREHAHACLCLRCVACLGFASARRRLALQLALDERYDSGMSEVDAGQGAGLGVALKGQAALQVWHRRLPLPLRAFRVCLVVFVAIALC